MTKQEFLQYLHTKNFTQLFVECFWDHPTTTEPYIFSVNTTLNAGASGISLVFHEVAQKNGYRIYVTEVTALPDTVMRRQIDAKLRKRSADYLVIYVVNSEDFHQLWSVPVKAVDKRQLVTIEYRQDDQAAFLLEKIHALAFSIEDKPTIIDVINKVNNAFLVNTADITKKFYQGFKKQHEAFVKGIENLSAKKDCEWYASVMLNRLMFCYFIQKKRFLDFNENYLGDKLKEVQSKKGKDKFYESFYRSFLKQLFSDGLDKPIAGRSAYFLKKYGKIPYLNGGMFSQHQIEKENKDIDIPDKVFENLFTFFDQWHWHLDNRITASGRDINPDVLGYIFEQYINDRAQMGAYYTKEDITEYIGRNCIVPYLFEAVKKIDSKPFAQNGAVWKLLKGSEDTYIFPAVKKGVDLPLPDYIEVGVPVDGGAIGEKRLSSAKARALRGGSLRERRAHWNEEALDAYALPTEIWRETVARRQRYQEIHNKITNGEITDIHDFITYNLDIRAFAEDVIRKTDDYKFVRHFYKALREVTVLDPTCGSGAFLFAALNILEPLYEACLDRIEEYHAANKNLFKNELEEIAGKFRSNRQYFIYKNIILRNLYGVDIMHEATEIARLRLFLKMVAVVDVDPYDENLGLDPLPDIDFNIRCGNTLVGYATEEEIEAGLINGDMFAYAELKGKIDAEMAKVSLAYDFFLREQLNLTGNHQQLIDAKKEVGQRLATIRNLLNDQLYARYSGKKKADWLQDTNPFHWYTEFYPIMHGRGGFDVIIGNPPYVEYSKVRNLYQIMGYATESCGNLYGFVMERSHRLLHGNASFGMIVPISLICTQRMEVVQNPLLNGYATWLSNYAERPSKLFTGADVLLTICLRHNVGCEKRYDTCFNKWHAEERGILFNKIYYTQETEKLRSYVLPKLMNSLENNIVKKVAAQKELGLAMLSSSNHKVFYRIGGGRYWKIFTSFSPRFVLNGKKSVSSRENYLYFSDEDSRNVIIAVLSSSLFFWYFIVSTNCRDLNPSDLKGFGFDLRSLRDSLRFHLSKVASDLMSDYEQKSEMKHKVSSKTGKIDYQEFYPKFSKPIIDEIDELLAKHYGFTEEELDFIINYDIKYRMGDELNAE